MSLLRHRLGVAAALTVLAGLTGCAAGPGRAMLPPQIVGQSGWLSDTLPRVHTDPMRVPAGRYTVSIACAGNGGLAYSIVDGAGRQLSGGGIACDGRGVAVPVEVPQGGVGGDLVLREGPLRNGPVRYAVALRRTA